MNNKNNAKKKLVLQKDMLVNLTPKSLGRIKGGAEPTEFGCSWSCDYCSGIIQM